MRDAPAAPSAAPPSLPTPPDPSGVAARVTGGRLRFGGALLFDGLDLELPAGSVTGLLGPSGVGKTTLLRLLAGLAAPEPPTRVERTGAVAWMAQQDLLMPWLSVLDNVLLGARLRGEARTPALVDRARGLLSKVGLGDRAADRPAALSGGMRQRVALARTLMEDRPIVLMDEPFSGLDAITRLRLQDLAVELLAGRTVLLVTHDPLEALRLADRVLVLTGRPARLSDPLCPPGAKPRAPDDPALLALQGRLLRALAAEAGG